MTRDRAEELGLRLVTTENDAAVTRLHGLIRPRENLRAMFQEGWRKVETFGPADELERWSAAAIDLLKVHAGPGSLLAYLSVSERLGRDLGLGVLAEVCREAVEICRQAGMRAAEMTLRSIPFAAPPNGVPADAEGLLARYRAMAGLATARPDCLLPLLEVFPTLARETSPDGFAEWIAAGLRASPDSVTARMYFALATPLSRRVLAETAEGGFAARERALAATFVALWGKRPRFILRAEGPSGEAVERTTLTDAAILVPSRPPRIDADLAARFFEAATAHVGAHIVFTPARMPVRKLKPVQIAVISAIEDARVEALAIEAMPGLRHLWAPFHVASPHDAPTAAGLIGRLARALFDPAYDDPEPWVAKGRRMFRDRAGRLTDPAMPREIGDLLGNDLGQMRLPFNPKTYVVEPAYRDDNFGVWDFADDPDLLTEMHAIMADAVRIDRREDRNDPDATEEEEVVEGAGRTRQTTASEPGMIVRRYPEWDYVSSTLRPDWTTVRQPLVVPVDAPRFTDDDDGLRRRIDAIIRTAKVGQAVRLRRQWEGEQIDLDAAIDASLEVRRGEMPDPRIFQRRAEGRRDLSALLLIDASESTRRTAAGAGRPTIDIEIDAARLVSSAMTALGDAHAIAAFRSSGRDEVAYLPLKGFDETAEIADPRLAALKPGLSTRLGAALRHATADLGGERALRKLLLVMTDGQPFDIDIDDPRYLAEDARQAVIAARDEGVDVFCVGLGAEDEAAGMRVFGRKNYLPVARLADLPASLASLYFRLAMR